MWMVTELKTVSRSFDLSSSGQGARLDLTLLAEGLSLVNMLGRVRWDAAPVQIGTCTSRAVPHCAPGGSVAVRRVPGFVLLVPSTRASGRWRRRVDCLVNPAAPPASR